MTQPSPRDDDEADVRQLLLRMTPAQRARLADYARETYRSLNASVLHLLEAGLHAEGKQWPR